MLQRTGTECAMVENETGLRNVTYLDSAWIDRSTRSAGALRSSRCMTRFETLQDDRDQRRPLSIVESETWFRNSDDFENAGWREFRFRWALMAQPATTGSTCLPRCAAWRLLAKGFAWSGSVAREAALCGWPRSDGAKALGSGGRDWEPGSW